MNGNELVSFIASTLNAEGVPPTDSAIVRFLRSLNETQLSGCLKRTPAVPLVRGGEPAL